MRRIPRLLACCVALALGMLSGSARADSDARPSEDALFGAPASVPSAVPAQAALPASPTASTAPSAPSMGAPSRGADTDQAGMSLATLGTDDFANGTVKKDPLSIGGVYYQQAYFDEPAYQAPGASALSMPLVMDTYLDARPNDRLRAFVDGRLIYDPTKNAEGASSASGNFGSLIAGTSAEAVSGTANPTVVLDQAWVKFDADQMVFFTAGKQHVKWGTGHIWNPTDFLTVQKLNPLQPYDLRLGNTMLKAEAPVPGMDGTNLYAIALLDNPQPAGSLGQAGGAFRAETVLDGAEVGVDAVTRAGLYPVYGFDLSSPLGPLDVYAEDAVFSGRNTLYQAAGGGNGILADYYRAQSLDAPADQTVVGASWDFAWRTDRQATLGAEYFYNETGLGTDAAKVLPILIYEGDYTPFYMGRNYAAIYFSAEGPDEGKKSNYNFSTILNGSDGSAVSRLDFTWLLLDYLTYGAWVAVHYGTPGGELNFALSTPQFSSPPIPPVNIAATPLEVGMSLRMAY